MIRSIETSKINIGIIGEADQDDHPQLIVQGTKMTKGEIDIVLENYKQWVNQMEEEKDKKYHELAG
jgi:hypothetical protein